MNAEPKRGTALLLAHLACLDEPSQTPARQRLDEALGPDLARRLVSALSAGAPVRRGSELDADLRARAVFAA